MLLVIRRCRGDSSDIEGSASRGFCGYRRNVGAKPGKAQLLAGALPRSPDSVDVSSATVLLLSATCGPLACTLTLGPLPALTLTRYSSFPPRTTGAAIAAAVAAAEGVPADASRFGPACAQPLPSHDPIELVTFSGNGQTIGRVAGPLSPCGGGQLESGPPVVSLGWSVVSFLSSLVLPGILELVSTSPIDPCSRTAFSMSTPLRLRRLQKLVAPAEFACRDRGRVVAREKPSEIIWVCRCGVSLCDRTGGRHLS